MNAALRGVALSSRFERETSASDADVIPFHYESKRMVRLRAIHLRRSRRLEIGGGPTGFTPVGGGLEKPSRKKGPFRPLHGVLVELESSRRVALMCMWSLYSDSHRVLRFTRAAHRCVCFRGRMGIGFRLTPDDGHFQRGWSLR